MPGKFTAVQLKAIEFLALSERNTDEICAELNINKTTLWRWKKSQGFMDAVIDKARAELRTILPAAYKQLSSQALTGSFKHLELLLNHIENLETQKSKYKQATLTFTWKSKPADIVSEDE